MNSARQALIFLILTNIGHSIVTAIEIVTEFLSLINQDRLDGAMNLLAEDVFYHNIPMDPIIGRKAWRASSHEFGMGTRLRTNWKTVAIAASGDTVLTERVDEFSTADGGRMSIPLMGSFRVRNGLIVEWRDYFDMKDFERQLPAIIPRTK